MLIVIRRLDLISGVSSVPSKKSASLVLCWARGGVFLKGKVLRKARASWRVSGLAPPEGAASHDRQVGVAGADDPGALALTVAQQFAPQEKSADRVLALECRPSIGTTPLLPDGA